MNCTVTSGGGPIPSAEDAVSPYASSVAKGELTVTDFTDCASDGEDILLAADTTLTKPLPVTKFVLLLHSTQICAALNFCCEDVFNGQLRLFFPAPHFTPESHSLPERIP